MPPFPTELADFLADFDAWVRGGKTPDDAAISARRFGLTPDECEMLKAEYLRRNQKFIDFTDPRVLRENKNIESWYSGPDFAAAWCWPSFKRMLTEGEDAWDPDDFSSLDQASTKILASLPHPGNDTFNCRGLVVGYVQSGKTANYSALISKAADAGYRLFIVLSGITSSLRQQTQGRLDSDVVRHAPTHWTWLTYPEKDFLGNPATADALIDVQSHRKRVIAVVKKNVTVLKRLKEWLELASMDTMSACPTLIIDDEADNASVNTNDPNTHPTAVNNHIRNLLQTLKKVAYVGYTATPFANIFINPAVPEDLFPRDFIFDLARPKAYFGAERIFGRSLSWFDTTTDEPDGLDMVRTIKTTEPDEPGMLFPIKARDRFGFNPTAPDSLVLAIDYFLLATAARFARGQVNRHSSMLVHTTLYIDLHDKLETMLKKHLADFRRDHAKRRKALKEMWEAESVRAPAEGVPLIAFHLLWAQLPLVLRRVSVVVDNGRPESTLKYSKEDPKVVIAVGGNTLSRGLTLEGLVVSYFIRRAGAYDTLLQMGRWFGYRRGYEDLPRIWTTDELQQQFFFLAGIEEEIRQDIHRLESEQKTPLELAIRVRTHPKLLITAKNKNRVSQLASASFSDRRVQSFLFHHDNPSWLSDNLEATRTLGNRLRARVMPAAGTGQLVKGVGVDAVLDFLSSYRFHPLHDELRGDLVTGYIKRENLEGALTQWNIAWLGLNRERPGLGTLDMGLASEVACISRTRFKATSPCNIKALISKADRVIDLEGVRGDNEDAVVVAARNRLQPGVGLLLLYPISMHSTPAADHEHVLGFCGACGKAHQVPKKGAPIRHPLDAVQHIVGAALVFPKAVTPEGRFQALNLASLFAPEEVEEGEVVADESGGSDN